METIQLDNIIIPIVKHRKARNMRLTIRMDGTLRITIPYFLPYAFGKKFALEKKDWLLSKLKALPVQTNNFSAEDIQQKKIAAKEIISKLVDQYAAVYAVKYRRISIRAQGTRWGSCSMHKNLNFNWRIILAPEDIQRYVVVHEVCHLREMNHSRKFWDLVEMTIPQYKACRKWLRKSGHSLF